MIPSAYLRVFQPLDGFERDEELHWDRYVRDRGARPARPTYLDRRTGDGIGLLAPADGEHAEVRVVQGRTYVAPDRMRLRVLAAMLAVRADDDFELGDRFVPKKVARHARRQLSRHRRRDPHAVAFVHQSPWHVPIRWFVLFRDDERRLADDERGQMRLRYSTTTRNAMRRAQNAIPVLRRSDLGAIGELLVDLHQWMAAFDPGSIVEIDYGGLCDSMTWDEMDDDHSAAEIQAALDALGKHEFLQAADVYQGVLARWAEARGRELYN
ncbi:MAG: hypothetical protein WD096_11980 [Actinomycetota bacterium]